MPRRCRRRAVLRCRPHQLSLAIVAAIALACLAGCADRAQRRPVSERPTAVKVSEPAASASGARKVRLDAPVRQRSPGPPSFKRSLLDRVLAAGPGALLQHVPLKPAFSGGQQRRFVGFRIARIFDNSPAVLRFGVQPGDLLRSVNGMRVTTPDQLMAVFKRLQNATVVQVSVMREGRRLDFAWPVIDQDRPSKRQTVGAP